MDDKAILVRSALLSDIKRWTETLTRQLGYLDEVASQLITSRYINRKSINRVQTLQIQIKTQLAKYHKEQQAVSKSYKHTAERYRAFMKRFSELVRETRLVRSLVSIRDIKSDYLSQSKSPKHYYEKGSPEKKYMQDTFNVKVNRDITASHLGAINQPHTLSHKKHYEENRRNIQTMIRTQSAKLKAKQGKQHQNYEQGKASTVKFSRYRSEPAIESDDNYYGLKSQMSSLKSLLLQLHRGLEFHRHPQLEDEVHKLKIRYNKMKMKIEDVKEENHLLLENISQINKELKNQRKRYREGQKESKLLRNGSAGRP